jgi:ATP-binding cassette subfamily B protein
MKKDNKHTIRQIARTAARSFAFAWQTSPLLFSALILFSLLISGIPYLQNGILGELINTIVDGTKTQIFSREIVFYLLILIASSLFAGVIGDLQSYCRTLFRFWFIRNTEIVLLTKKASIDIALYHDKKFNDLVNIAQERGTGAIYQLIDATLSNIANVFAIIVASIILIKINPLIFVLAFVGTLPVIYVEKKYGSGIYWIWDMNAEKRREYFNKRSHFMNSKAITELKLFQNIKFFISHIHKVLLDFDKEVETVERKKLIADLLSFVIQISFFAWSLYIIINQTIMGIIAVGTLTFLYSTMRGLQGSLSSTLRYLGEQEEMSRFSEAQYKLMDTQPVIIASKNPQKLNLTQPPEITFENIWFRYPESTTDILKGISFTVHPGENIAIVGHNGAGKTTLMFLLCRIYDPTQGRVLINGIDIKELDIDEWWSYLGILFQDYETYHFKIKEVIALGRSEKPFNLTKVIEAAQHSRIYDTIQALPMKFDQQLGKGFTDGVELSKGNEQRLALARLFYRNAFINILDEPTASIDAKAEEEIFENLDTFAKGKVVINISHRFSTVLKSDKIYVIEHGKIAEQGSHAELLKKKGMYAELFNAQAKYFQAEN